MALRLPRDLNPFSRRTPRELTAREAFEVAEGRRRRWAESEFARLCCVYAGPLEGEDPSVGPLSLQGKSRLWHFDYYAAEAERFLRVQVYDGESRGEEIRIRAGGLDYPQMTFPLAAYGYCEDRDRKATPATLPEDWVDSPRLMESLHTVLSPDAIDRIRRVAGFCGIVMPASCLSPHVLDPDPGKGENGLADGERLAALIFEDPGDGPKLRIMKFDLRTGAAAGEGP